MSLSALNHQVNSHKVSIRMNHSMTSVTSTSMHRHEENKHRRRERKFDSQQLDSVERHLRNLTNIYINMTMLSTNTNNNNNRKPCR